MSETSRDIVARWAEALQGEGGRRWWRGLEELADSPGFQERLAAEFPPGADEPPDAVSRRRFLGLLGASAALAGVGACTQTPRERILPYSRDHADIVPGRPAQYATAMEVGGFATGLLVTSREGRPIKVEGNPAHPASLGAAGVYEQASVLQLYDPHRARGIRRNGSPGSWRSFITAFRPPLLEAAPGGGAGLHFLLEPTGSPLVGSLITGIQRTLPEARFHFWSPLGTANSMEGLRQTTGQPLQVQYDLRRARVIVALDADLLAQPTPFYLRNAREWAEARRVRSPEATPNRMYVVEPSLTPTGMVADHRFARRAGDIEGLAGALLAELVSLGARPEEMPGELDAAVGRLRAPESERGWIAAMARDLQANRGASVVAAGDRQPPLVHALVHLINAALGNTGRTVRYAESPLVAPARENRGLEPLVQAMQAGQVQSLVILDGNPSYSAPPQLEFAKLLGQVPTTVYLGLYENETAADCQWFIPQAHYLESWGDARALDGTVSIVQPLIEPLYAGRTISEVLSVFAGQPRSAHEIVMSYWRFRFGEFAFQQNWEQALQRGVVEGTASAPADATVSWEPAGRAVAQASPLDPSEGLEIAFAPSYSLYDGRFANNGWLLELPDPATKLTWDNAALMSPATAARLGLEQERILEVKHHGRTVRLPALILPGHADEAITVHLGWGRSGEEVVARDVGVNAAQLMGPNRFFERGVAVEPTGESRRLALTQVHWELHGRPIVAQASLEEFRRDPKFAKIDMKLHSLYDPFKYEGQQWAMGIDLSICTGCNACVVACQAENNIPIVGREGVLRGREMHWIRIDRYFSGPPEAPQAINQPMLCQHCEMAPCEYVCPVNATTHSPDGLNEMTYNRCVGTRFCSNNCPYKVRRFNWFDYTKGTGRVERMRMNPEVTVRSRGVIEKCTFCVQRIRNAQIDARVSGQPMRDGELQSACSQACPTTAIAFGSIGDPESEVSRRAAQPNAFQVLAELGTRPRVRYLARIDNPNPEMS